MQLLEVKPSKNKSKNNAGYYIEATEGKLACLFVCLFVFHPLFIWYVTN